MPKSFLPDVEMMPGRDYVSQTVLVEQNGLIIASRWIRRFALVLVPVCALASVFTSWAFLVVSVVTVLLGAILLATTFLEVVLGAGFETQRQYIEAGRTGREVWFTPSIPDLRSLALPLAVGTASVVVAFSGITTWLSNYAPGSYSLPMYGITSLYFSIVTFTSGVGDISARSDLARVAVSLEIFVAWIEITVVIAATISWVLTHHQRRTELAMREGGVHTRAVEEALRTLRMGMYQEAPDASDDDTGDTPDDDST